MELEEFLETYVEDHLGEPHMATVHRRADVIIAIPRKDFRPYKGWEADWEATAEHLINELRAADLGEYRLEYVAKSYIELEKLEC